MNVSPYYEQAIRSYSAEDKAFFDKATGFLPKRKETTPYHSGPHSVRSLRMAYELAGRPANVLEIGFCIGYSAALWFALGAERVISFENSERDQTQEALNIMHSRFDKRFIHAHGMTVKYAQSLNLGLIFIDGDHSIEGVDRDTRWALAVGVPYILFDDLDPKWGPGTVPAIENHGLKSIAILGAMCLCIRGENWISG